MFRELLARGLGLWQRQKLIGTGDVAALVLPLRIALACHKRSLGCGEMPRVPDTLAETDRNRTCQTELLGLTGFEDRGAHQDTYASIARVYT